MMRLWQFPKKISGMGVPHIDTQNAHLSIALVGINTARARYEGRLFVFHRIKIEIFNISNSV